MALDRNSLVKPVKKLRKLIGKMDSHPAPEKVHALRTNTRRFEAMFEALSLAAQGIGKSTLKDLGTLRKRAGKVRDLDVLTGFASTVHLKGEEECEVELLERLGADRYKQARKLAAEIRRLGPDLRKELKRAPAVLARLLEKDKDAEAAEATSVALKLTAQLAGPRRLNRQTLHPFRLKVKELRNVLQMSGGAGQSKLVDDLGIVKDAIGEWHDWEELVSIAKKVLEHGAGCGLLKELKGTAEQKYAHALELVETLRKNHLRAAKTRAPKKGPATADSRIPGEAVEEVTALLAK
jgi:CHAD domain-containing protein